MQVVSSLKTKGCVGVFQKKIEKGAKDNGPHVFGIL